MSLPLIAISQRVVENESYPERRDALDQRWTMFLIQLGAVPLLVPNKLANVGDFLDEFGVDGMILSGGNSLSHLAEKDSAAERDTTESQLIDYAIANDIPLIGVCRGMEMIAHHFDVPVIEVPGHVNVRHVIEVPKESDYFEYFSTRGAVNSYHKHGVALQDMKDPLEALTTIHGVVEALKHQAHPIYGIMWHPEREEPFVQEDLALFTYLLAL